MSDADYQEIMVDPPSGWRYGFPAKWNKVEYPTLEEFYRSKGYPEKDMDLALSYTRMWVAE